MQGQFVPLRHQPVEPSQLIRTIRSHVRSHHALPEAPGRGCRLLVVDDDPIQLKLLESQLGQRGFRVTAGMFCDCNRRYGFELSGFYTETKANDTLFQSSPAGTPSASWARSSTPTSCGATIRIGSLPRGRFPLTSGPVR